jgi:sporulation protein YlmC with PRC-barrel domain
MRSHRILAASVAALMAIPAMAQETQPADPAARPGAAVAPEAAAGTNAGPATTGGAEVRVIQAQPAGTEAETVAPVTLSAAVARLQQAADQLDLAWTGTGMGVDPTTGMATGVDPATGLAAPEVGLGTTPVPADGTVAGTADPAMDPATGGAFVVTPQMTEARDHVLAALDDFDRLFAESVDGSDAAAAERVALVQQQSQELRTRLQGDNLAGVGDALRTLTSAAMQQSQIDAIPAGTDRIVGRQVTSADGEQAGTVTDVLISPEGAVVAVVVERGGLLGLGVRRTAVAWDRVQFQGGQILLTMTLAEVDLLPDYVTD